MGIKNFLKKSRLIMNCYEELQYYKSFIGIRFFYINTIKKRYKKVMKKDLDLDNPVSFSEKLQWLKVNYRDELLTQCCDKYKVREYIKKTIGKEYLNELYCVYSSFNEIDFSKLPNEFVLKVNHSSGRLLICTNKKEINWEKQQKKFTMWLRHNYYYISGEWSYKDIKPKIICEKLLEKDITDYKFYCFNGQPQFLYVSKGASSRATEKNDFYDLEWNKASFERTDYPGFDYILPKPKNYNKMLSLCCELAKPFPFVRVDLYEVDCKIYFSELTFYPTSGYTFFSPKEYDKIIGQKLILP